MMVTTISILEVIYNGLYRYPDSQIDLHCLLYKLFSQVTDDNGKQPEVTPGERTYVPQWLAADLNAAMD